LNSTFIDAQTHLYKLEDTSEEAVRLLVHWFYTQKLDTIPHDSLSVSSSLVDSEYLSLFQLWILGDRLLVPRLQDMVIREIDEIGCYFHSVPEHCTEYVYENTSPGHPLRRYFVEEYARLGSSWYTSYSEHPKEMLVGLVAFLSDVITPQQRGALKRPERLSQYEVPEDKDEVSEDE
jgi:hypothetical protein